MGDFDSLKVTVSDSKSGGGYGQYYRGEIEEDVWHEAKLVKIIEGENNFKGKKSPAWVFIYELLGEEFTTENQDGEEVQCIVQEKTSQKLSTPPRSSKAYERYAKLTGKEPEVGEDIDLTTLFGKECKIMIRNAKGSKKDNEGNPYIFHNIEKITTKGVEQEESDESEEESEEKPKKKKKKAKKKTKKKKKKPVKEEEESEEDDDDGDLFDELLDE